MMSAKTNSDVVQFCYNDSFYDKIIKNMLYKSTIELHMFNDVKQDLYYFVLMGTNVVDIFNRGEFKYWFIQMCNNQLRSTRSKIYFKYKKKSLLNDEFDGDFHGSSYEIDFDTKIDNADKYGYILGQVNKHINVNITTKRNLEIWKMYYIDDMTMAEISKNTSIPTTSVYNYIEAARKFVETIIDKNLFIDRDDNTDYNTNDI